MAKEKDVKIIASKVCVSTSALLEMSAGLKKVVRRFSGAGGRLKMFLTGEMLLSKL